MNLIPTSGAGQTMSSREIADLVDSRHDSVKRSIDRLIATQVIVRPPSVDEQIPDDMGRVRTTSVYMIGKRDTYVIVAQLSPQFTARLVDRWQELEAVAAAPVEMSRLELLELAIASERERIALTAQVAAQAPAVAFVANYVDSTSGAKGFREVCKLLRANEAVFRQFLIDKKIMYRLGKELTPFAPHLDAGRFEVKAGTAEATGHAYNRAKFTAKGINWIAGEWSKYQVAAKLAKKEEK